jgi:hypothetical protein
LSAGNQNPRVFLFVNGLPSSKSGKLAVCGPASKMGEG